MPEKVAVSGGRCYAAIHNAAAVPVPPLLVHPLVVASSNSSNILVGRVCQLRPLRSSIVSTVMKISFDDLNYIANLVRSQSNVIFHTYISNCCLLLPLRHSVRTRSSSLARGLRTVNINYPPCLQTSHWSRVRFKNSETLTLLQEQFMSRAVVRKHHKRN